MEYNLLKFGLYLSRSCLARTGNQHLGVCLGQARMDSYAGGGKQDHHPAEKTMSKPGPACLRLAEHPDPDLMAHVTKAGHDLSIEKNDDVIC
ncbi:MULTISPECIES: hypothetical protein [Desulfotignum]|jgi:hypothetical protein|uniref:hypothetical protein n=1 Tax=Desulfotignum TaxID=115780 RepID=UPI001267B770|nr:MULTISPECIES: hypothetical protein [Desulfotignum]